MSRTLLLICLIEILAIFLCGCGGGATRLPPQALSITTATLPDWMATFAYAQTLQATGGVSPFSWSVSSGNLPHGLTAASSSSNSAVITGTPDVVGTSTFTIQVTDAKRQAAMQSYSLQIKSLVSAQLVPVRGQVAPGTIEIQRLGQLLHYQFRGLLRVHSCYNLQTRQVALCDPLQRRLRPLCYLHRRSDCYRVERSSSRTGLFPLWTSAFHGAPYG